MRKYRGIFFDWDGTAVTSRKAPVDEVILEMKKLLKNDVKLAIISGTTIENIAGGNLEDYFEEDELKNLFLGLGRGAYNYRFGKNKKIEIFSNNIPNKELLLKIHKVCFDIHLELLEKYDFKTDIVFSRPNYCKIDLMVDSNRGDNLFFQEDELMVLKDNLKIHNFYGGVQGLIELAVKIGEKHGLLLSVTTDAKYLEVGLSTKSDNVDCILEYFNENFSITPDQCSFWGDEYIGLDENLYGSDSFMITELSRDGDFFDVSNAIGYRPKEVKVISGGVNRFLKFLNEQGNEKENE